MPQPESRGIPLADLADEAERVLEAARTSRLVVRLVGGLAIRRICPSAARPPLSRSYADIDLAISGSGGQREALTAFMVQLGYTPNQTFNALHGNTRLYFDDLANHRHIDVFVDAVRMCHEIWFKNRLTLVGDTLTPTDLLLTKLQIVQLNQKDLLDALALLHDMDLQPHVDSAVDLTYLEDAWSDNWPLWRTCQLNLVKLAENVPSILESDGSNKVSRAISALEELLTNGRKTLRWRLRAGIGDRVRWYDLPEEVE